MIRAYEKGERRMTYEHIVAVLRSAGIENADGEARLLIEEMCDCKVSWDTYRRIPKPYS